jgi:hypothetical protein
MITILAANERIRITDLEVAENVANAVLASDMRLIWVKTVLVLTYWEPTGSKFH